MPIIQNTYGSPSQLFSLFALIGCTSADKAAAQARTDLTADHVRGLYSGMVRNDVEDLLGTSDKSLAEHESVEVYSLADGTTAVLRYRDDQLLGAYLRDKDNVETSLFHSNNANMPGINGVNETGSSLNGNETTTTDTRMNTDRIMLQMQPLKLKHKNDNIFSLQKPKDHKKAPSGNPDDAFFMRQYKFEYLYYSAILM